MLLKKESGNAGRQTVEEIGMEKLRGLRSALLVSLLVGSPGAAAEGMLTFSPPAKIIEVGSSTMPVFSGAPEGYGFLHLSAPLPAECPNVYLHIPFNGTTGSKAMYTTAQMAFLTGTRVSQVIWRIEQGSCVINHIFLVQ
jgi:hypothetical protein